MDDAALMATLLEGFAAEARDISHRVTGQLLELEQETSDTAARQRCYEDLARGLHTLKGNLSTFGFPQLADLAHRMEDVIGDLRPSLAPIPAHAIDILLRSIDVLVARIATRSAGDDPAVGELLAGLVAVRGHAAEVSEPLHGDAADVSAPPRPPSASTTPRKETTPAAADAQDRPLEDWRIGPRNVEMLLREVERLRELRLRLDEHKRDLDRTLRNMDMKHTADVTASKAVLASLSRTLGVESEAANDVIDGLESELKAVATLPLYMVLEPMQRAVRDLCRTLGKQARLAIVGAEISLDRRLLEALRGPLLHLVRNAVDHGIEAPAVRAAAGKHTEGSVSIRVERSGNLVVLEVEDDGAGIDGAQIRHTAEARGIATAEELETMEDRELHQLVFRSGFSTRREVSDISGRGVGLDVVRSAVQALAGHVELHSSPRAGSRFVLTLPVALGATPVLVVRVDEQAFGIPMVAVETIRVAKPEHVHVGRANTRFEHGEHILPLFELGVLLALRAKTRGGVEGRPALIVSHRGQRAAVVVDDVVGDRELVVRPLPAELYELPYQGAAMHARGELLLVLEPSFLVDQSRAGETASSSTESARRALVVDDSLTARALHRTILESGGYQVHAVGSARQALDHLRQTYYDIVIADVMMPDIDGLQFTSMMRGRTETRDTPVILVSAHDAAPDRDRGLAAGADVFISKKDCISGRLLGEVGALIARRDRPR